METRSSADEHALALDGAAFAKLLAVLPLANYRAGETILTAGSKSNRLLFLKSGAVVVLKDSIEIARANVHDNPAFFMWHMPFALPIVEAVMTRLCQNAAR